ncbi:hypothetical protein KO317_00150 [Candidatus Micrarchaeota archaeon]|nr:hypothetical protein [Candidatus Micrarchaeota archaeon]
MEFDELLISTGVDALIKLVHEREKIELEKAADELELPFQTVESWAQVLEEQGIIKIDYQFTKVYLSWIQGAEGKILEKVGDVKTQKENLKQMINSIKKRIEEKSKELEDIEKEYHNILNLFDPKLVYIQQKVKEMEKLGTDAQEILQQHHSKLNNLKIDLDSFSEHLIKKEKEWKELYANISDPNNRLKGFKELKYIELKLKTDMENSIKEIENIQNIIKEQKSAYSEFKNMDQQLESTKKEIEILKKIITQTKEQTEDINSTYKTIKQNLKNGSFEDTIFALKNIKGTIPEIIKQTEEIKNKIETQIIEINKLENAYKKIETKEGKLLLEILEKRLKTFEENTINLEKIIKKVENTKKTKIDIKKQTVELENLDKEVSKQKDVLIKKTQKIKEEIDKVLDPINEFDSKYKNLKETVLFYSKRMENLEKEYNSKRESIKNEQEEITKKMGEYNKLVKQEIIKINESIEKYETIIKEKNDIDRVFIKIREIKEMKNNITIELEVLNKKIDLVRLPRKKGEAIEISSEIREFGDAVELNKTEEKILQRKRKELRDLIKEMWES